MRFVVPAVVGMLICSASALAAPPDFPGVGSEKAWLAGCQINDKASALMQEGKYKKAAELLNQAIAKYPYETGFYNNLGHCDLSLDDSKGAEAAFKKAVELCEKYKVKYPDSYLELARLSQKRGAAKDADLYFKKATKLDGSRESWKDYADFLDSQKRTAEAAAARKKADELDKAHKQFLKDAGK